MGVKHLVKQTTAFLYECGVAYFNIIKSYIAALFGDGHLKNAVIDASASFTINSQLVQVLS